MINLDPKSKEQILHDMQYLDVYEFEKSSKKFKELYNEEITKHFYPLSIRINNHAKEHNYLINSQLIKVKNTKLYFYNFNNKLMMIMFPCRKIKEIERIRSGNNYTIKSFADYMTIINFLEKK